MVKCLDDMNDSNVVLASTNVSKVQPVEKRYIDLPSTAVVYRAESKCSKQMRLVPLLYPASALQGSSMSFSHHDKVFLAQTLTFFFPLLQQERLIVLRGFIFNIFL